MTETYELRRLLDERGVEWEATADAPDSLTTWATGSDTARWCADELINDRFDLYAYNVDEDVSGLTPTQAIDATLGRGTCHFEQIPEALYDDIECSECGVALWGFQMDIAGEGCPTRPRYCPNCGKRVDNG